MGSAMTPIVVSVPATWNESAAVASVDEGSLRGTVAGVMAQLGSSWIEYP